MFDCSQCKKRVSEKKRTFVGRDWCDSCVEIEAQRSLKQDTVVGSTSYSRVRPPKYMLDPQDYAKFRY